MSLKPSHYIALLILSFAVSPLYAQPHPDSLLHQQIRFWEAQTRYDSMHVYADMLIESGKQEADNAAIVAGAFYKGRAAFHLEKYAEALSTLSSAEPLLEDIEDKSLTAKFLSQIGLVHDYQGAWETAMPYYQQALSLFQALGNQTGIATTLNNIGILHDMLGDYEQAISYYNQGLALREQLGDKQNIAASLNNLGIVHRIQGKHDEALTFYVRALALREEVGDKRDIATSLNNIGVLHDHLGNYSEALLYHMRSLELKEELGNRRGMASSLMNIGKVQYGLGNYDAALSFYERTLAIDSTLGDKNGIGSALEGLGTVLFALGDYDTALSHLFRSLSFKEEVSDKKGIASVLMNIGGVYGQQGLLDDALGFYERARAVNEEIGNASGIATAYNHLGTVSFKQKETDQALTFFLRALEIREGLEDKKGVAASLTNMGDLYRDEGNFKEALSFYNRALEMVQELGSKAGLVDIYTNLGNIYLQTEQFDEALAITDEALFIADSIGALVQVRDASEQRALIFERQGDYAASLDAYKDFVAAKDTLLNSESQSVIAELQERYRTKEQGQQIVILEEMQKNQTLWLGGLIAGIILLSIVAFLIYNGYRIKKHALAELDAAHVRLQSTQAQLIHQEKLASLGQLTAGIAHEIKNPLNFVNNFAQLNRDLVGDLRIAIDERGEVEELLVDLEGNAIQIAKHGGRADQIVKNMMQHATESSGRHQEIELNALVKEWVTISYHSLKSLYPKTEISVDMMLSEEVKTVMGVPQEIGRVMQNILTNAYDALGEEQQSADTRSPLVKVSTSQSNGQVFIRVTDNGSGIPEKIRDKVFEPFFTTKEAGSGAGLGLSMSHDIIKSHGGDLVIENTSDGGTTLTIQLPSMENNA